MADDEPAAKRSRLSESAVAIYDEKRELVAVDAAQARTSDLFAPNMHLTGHGAAVYSLKFSPDGQHLASASFDRRILLWNVYGEHCANYSMIEGHKNAVLEVHWSADGEELVSCSADTMVSLWDAVVGTRLRKLQGHSAVVNSCCPSRKGALLVASGGDDKVAKLWDARAKACQATFRAEEAQAVTAVALSDDASQLFAGGIDNVVRVWDARKGGEVLRTLAGHTHTITSLSLSPDGNHLLSNGMDNAVRCWDVRPFVAGDGGADGGGGGDGARCVKQFTGASHNFEQTLLRCSWSADGAQVGCGSSDRNAYVWDFDTATLMYQLPGHKGAVNEVAFHPKEPIVGSCSSDKTIFLGEVAA